MTGAKRRFIGSLAIALALSVPSSAVADEEPIVLDPVTEWQLDYGRGSCTLVRNFGNEGRQVTLQMMRTVPSQMFHFIVSSRGWRLGDDALKFAVLPDVATSPTALQNRAENSDAAAIRFDASLRASTPDTAEPASEDRLATVEGFLIERAFEHSFILRTGPLAAADQAMKACVADLWSEKGVDLA